MLGERRRTSRAGAHKRRAGHRAQCHARLREETIRGAGTFADSAPPVPWGISLRGVTLQMMPDSTAMQREFAEAGRYPQTLLVDAYRGM